MLVCYRKTDRRIVHSAMSTTTEITHDIACIDKGHTNHLCAQAENNQDIAHNPHKYLYDDTQSPPVITRIKNRYARASCPLEAIRPGVYRGTSGGNTSVTISFIDEDGNTYLPICRIKLKCSRGSLSQREFVLNGDTGQISFIWTFPDETVDLKLSFCVIDEPTVFHFNNESFTLMAVELE